MAAFSTNLHFHGLAIPPVCHQDETLRTVIQPGDLPFEYRIQISKDQPPGLYWYHPHIHGFSEEQVLGGASGALIVEGIEHVNAQVAGLKERVLIIRDEKMPKASPEDQPDPNKPTKQISIDYIPVPYPKYPPAIIQMKPAERQFWRVLNASADTYLDLRIEFNGKAQEFSLVALDGVPLRYGLRNVDSRGYAPLQTHIALPPAGRAELIVTGPASGADGLLVTNRVYRGAADENGPVPLPVTKNDASLRTGQDDVDPTRPLAILSPTDDSPPQEVQAASASPPERSATARADVPPARKRTLYFSEKLVNPADPKSATLFFITEEGQTPAVFDAGASAPNILVHQGDVEDWTIENRSQESHAFHIHQLHFLVVGARLVPWEEPALRDTVNLPAWDGIQRYPSVTLRMDFRDPRIAGIFPYHCHIMQHIDGGMMGTVLVQPRH